MTHDAFSSVGSASPAKEAIHPAVAGTEELAIFLNELLEAERAGARVTLESARTAPTAELAMLLHDIQRDEARWCAMLLRQLQALGKPASRRIGDFHARAMAMEDFGLRLVFLNRGQGWVVRRLREMIPRVADGALRVDLCHMLSSHVANITLVNSAPL
jgi:nitronate monooxygenase